VLPLRMPIVRRCGLVLVCLRVGFEIKKIETNCLKLLAQDWGAVSGK
jgi:hypothetical protein